MRVSRLFTATLLFCSASFLIVDRSTAQQAGIGTITLETLGYSLGNGYGYYYYTDPTPVPIGSTQYAYLSVKNQGGGAVMNLGCYVRGGGVIIFQGMLYSNFSAVIQWTPMTAGTYDIECDGFMNFPGGHYPGSGYPPQIGGVDVQTTSLTITVK